MIEKALASWHDCIRGKGELADLIADDCVFTSPVVFRPQRGKEITLQYLGAARYAFSDEKSGKIPASGGGEGAFRYVREVVADPHAVLEFEVTLGGVFVNGVDMITANDEGKIVDFKVMLRPLRAVNKVHELMGRQLEKMTGGGE